MWKRNKINIKNNKNIQIQCIDWVTDNIKYSIEHDDEENEENEEKTVLEYDIKLFGITPSGQSICVNIEKFTPYFFIEIPENINWKKSYTTFLKQYIVNQINCSNLSSMSNDLIERF